MISYHFMRVNPLLYSYLFIDSNKVNYYLGEFEII